MNCHVPGRIIVAPRKDLESVLGAMRNYADQEVSVAWSMEEVLYHYDLKDGASDLKRRIGPLPFVARVPEGEEHRLSEMFSRKPEIRCSFPDYYTQPTGIVPTLNDAEIEQALIEAGVQQSNFQMGASVNVAILDTGVEPRLLQNSQALRSQQYDAETCAVGPNATLVQDSVGHGSLVAHIVNRISPAAGLLSVRVMDKTGTIGSLLAGIYLAEAAIKPDIFNLSLSFNCEADLCSVCGSPHESGINIAQIRLLFAQFDKARVGGPSPVFIAAAGNNRKSIALPALFPRIIAVGAYDFQRKRESDYSSYNTVPEDRFVLAPGGGARSGLATLERGDGTWEQKPLFGTSFSTAFVTGTLARYIGSLSGTGAVGGGGDRRFTDTFQLALDYLSRTSDRSWTGFESKRHGLGVLRWDANAGWALGSPGQVFQRSVGKQLFIVVDTTGSMDTQLPTIADHVAELAGRFDDVDTTLRLVLFGDHKDPYTVYTHCVSTLSSDIANAIRTAPRTNGDDTPEALEDALHFINDEIESMRLPSVDVVVFTDAPPHSPQDCPGGWDFATEIQRLRSAGARVDIVGCPTAPADAPASIFTCSLHEHAWHN